MRQKKNHVDYCSGASTFLHFLVWTINYYMEQQNLIWASRMTLRSKWVGWGRGCFRGFGIWLYNFWHEQNAWYCLESWRKRVCRSSQVLISLTGHWLWLPLLSPSFCPSASFCPATASGGMFWKGNSRFEICNNENMSLRLLQHLNRVYTLITPTRRQRLRMWLTFLENLLCKNDFQHEETVS